MYLKPILKAIPLLIALHLLWFFIFHYTPAEPGYSPPIHLFLGDAINLLIHEAGHFFFSWLGRTLYLMGGSITQILLPAVIAFFVWWNHSEHTVYPLFWTGWNICNVSIYVADAPFRKLRLIKAGLTHDWHAIMNRLDMMESAVMIGDVLHWIGIAVCAFAIAHGVKTLVMDVRYAREESTDRE